MRSRSQPAIRVQTDMQNSSIELKSSQFTLTLVMDPLADFDQILADVTDKFLSSSKFFRGAQMALEFRGRELSGEQQREVVSAIRQSCSLDIICILEKDPRKEEAQYRAITQVLKDRPDDDPVSDSSLPAGSGGDSVPAPAPGALTADICRGTVKNGQKILSDRSVLVLGDVEPLAEISCSGSIFVTGYALGTLRAGLGGDPHSFAAALVLKPQNLEVCGHRGISGIRKKTMDDSYTISPQAAVVEDGHLKMMPVSGKTWNRFFEKGRVQNQS